MLTAKRKALINLKNIPGWRTTRKIVVFSVDDYGNIRMSSEKARSKLSRLGLEVDKNRFDQYDCLEDKADLELLFDTLTSVKDKNGQPAVFTAFSMPANIDFQKIIDSGCQDYFYELLPDTFQRLKGYEGTWTLWKEGIQNKLLFPQFHGREHLNVDFLIRALKKQNPQVLACMDEACYGALTMNPDLKISYEQAYAFSDFSENKRLTEIALDGLVQFEKVFGFKAKHFTAPGTSAHHVLEEALAAGGIQFIDTTTVKKEHQGRGAYKYKYHTLGMKNKAGQRYILRNCVFEPLLNRNLDVVDQCLNEIAIAFRWHKPANISSHRVNFCGRIDPEVRAFGLAKLGTLLRKIVHRWPDVEFMTTVDLGHLISQKG